MLDLDYVTELFEEAAGKARRREWYGLGFQIVRRLRPAGPIEHCEACGLPLWWHDRWGCRVPEPIPVALPSVSHVAWRRRLTQQQARYRARRKAAAA